MKLYIRIENGFPVNHPAVEENLIQVFGKIPDNWEPFVRVEDPTRTNHKLVKLHFDPLYVKKDGVWYDHWEYRHLTPEELEETYRPIKEAWKAKPYAHNFVAWTFNEETRRYEAPIPRPSDHGHQGKFYAWSGKDNAWKLAPLPPNDGKRYYFDFDLWDNVEIPTSAVNQNV